MRIRNTVALLLVITALAGCPRVPLGAGQTEDSPNAKYSASAMFFYDGKKEWLVYKVQEKASWRVLWTLDTGHRKDTDPPFDQGFGNFDYIQWSNDSSEVRFAFKCKGTTTVTEWMAVRFDASGKPIDQGKTTNSGFLPENKLERSPR